MTLTAIWLDLGFLPYTPAFSIQEQLFEARLAGYLPSIVVLQENPPTFTIGRAGSTNGQAAANLLISSNGLEQRGFEILEVNRGGDITYHGPGQIIASPLLYLGDIEGPPANCPNANAYLHRLEDVLIAVLDRFGLHGEKHGDQPGVWLGEEKIGAVGIAVRHGYTFHGLSLNVNLELSPFELINPCGIPHMQVTSMQARLGKDLPLEMVKLTLRQVISDIFGLNFNESSWEILQSAITKEL